VHLGTPHRVGRALDGRLRRAVLTDGALWQDDGDSLRIRSPERLDPSGREVVRPLGIELRGAPDADDHHAGLAVMRRDAVEPSRTGLHLGDPIDDRLDRAR